MRHLFVFCCVIFSVSHVFAQSPNIVWQHCYGGYGNDGGGLYATSDGGYFIAGGIDSSGGDVTQYYGVDDYWPLKIDATGNLQWQHTYGSSYIDNASMGLQTDDGGYIVVGTTLGNDHDVTGNYATNTPNSWIIKLNAAGNLVWKKLYGGSTGAQAFAIRRATDGGYIIIGGTGSNDHDVSGNHGGDDAWVIKLDTAGNLQWQHCYGSTAFDYGEDIWPTADGGYIMACLTEGTDGDVTNYHTGVANSPDIWVVKITQTGAIQWEKAFGGSDNDNGALVRQTTDGGYIVLGSTKSTDGDITYNHGGYDAWLFKLDAVGNLIWQKTLGGSGAEYVGGLAITPDGGCTIGSTTNSTDGDVIGLHGNYDVWLVHLDANGIIKWSKTYGGPGTDAVGSVLYNIDGSYTVAGNTNGDGGDVSGLHVNGTTSDVWVFKTDIPNAMPALSISNTAIYPNPANDVVTINTEHAGDYSVQNIWGKEVLTGSFSVGKNELDISKLPAGNYMIRMGEWVIKFVKE